MFQLSWHLQGLCFLKTCVLLSLKFLLSLTHLHLPHQLLAGQAQDCRVLHQQWLWMRSLNLLNHSSTHLKFGSYSQMFKSSSRCLVNWLEREYLHELSHYYLIYCPLKVKFLGVNFLFPKD